jgi:hypothetical protein
MTGKGRHTVLALNITPCLRDAVGDQTDEVRSCAERWWAIADGTLADYADEVLAVANNIIVAVFKVRGWRRDPDVNNSVIFDLVEAPAWQWLIGQNSPITWHGGRTNPVRKLGGIHVDVLRERRPHRIDAGHGWSLDVDPDGNTATVRGPGTIVVTAIHDNTTRLAITVPGHPSR